MVGRIGCRRRVCSGRSRLDLAILVFRGVVMGFGVVVLRREGGMRSCSWLWLLLAEIVVLES